MNRHHSNSLALAEYLNIHPCVDRVNHPLLTSHPSHKLAVTQKRGLHSGVFSFYVKEGIAEITQDFLR